MPSAFRSSQIGEAMNRPGPPEGIVIDPDGLTAEQRTGYACVACQKRWPRPRHTIGALPDTTPIYACDDCAPALYRALRETAALADRAAPAFRDDSAEAPVPADGADARDGVHLPPARAPKRARPTRPSRR